jgi:hypothetical protein
VVAEHEAVEADHRQPARIFVRTEESLHLATPPVLHGVRFEVGVGEEPGPERRGRPEPRLHHVE